MPAAGTRRSNIQRQPDHDMQPLPHISTTRSSTAIAITTDLRMYPRDHKLRALDHGLRVRMLTGWVHHHP